MRHSPRRQRGMTLIELIMTLVVLGIVLVALYVAQASIISRSVDPLLQQQGLYLAEGVLEALQAMPKKDAGEHADEYKTARTLLNSSNGQPMDILQNYQIKFECNKTPIDSTNPTFSTVKVDCKEIGSSPTDLTSFTVTVSSDGQSISLTGYRHYDKAEVAEP